MTTTTTTAGPLMQMRWSCRQCGRFLAEDHISDVTRIDPSAYYGVESEVFGDCAKCGIVVWPNLLSWWRT